MSQFGVFRQRLAQGDVLLGASVVFSDPRVTEALAPSVDFIWLARAASLLALADPRLELLARLALPGELLGELLELGLRGVQLRLHGGLAGPGFDPVRGPPLRRTHRRRPDPRSLADRHPLS